MTHRLAVLVPTPAHSALAGPLSYRSELPLAPGTLVRVPLGSREVLGLVWDAQPEPVHGVEPVSEKPVAAVLDGIAPLASTWRRLVTFAANYYQRGPGEVALAALPPQLRDLDAVQLARRLKRPQAHTVPGLAGTSPALTDEQRQALAALDEAGAQGDAPAPFLLHGATGSGKTEVYLRAVQALLERDAQAQALVMVPEINLTPQLQQRFEQRFGAAGVVALHSGMTPAQRLKSWLAAHAGAARIVLGTRMAVFASI
ncbi:MAG TPA: DEAD/DEAH box helicase, partial [Ramlibacter sp.]|nr:DEAD/DEAH box helicase [Ramlibacter sp.]